MEIIKARMTARIEGEFVIFLIGARLNKWWKLWQFKWVGEAMGAMVDELEAVPDMGFLGVENFGFRRTIMVQYWRSLEQLMAYARQKDAVHFPAWARFNREIGSNGDVGIWHETYVVKPGEFECVYNNMPAYGLARATEMVPAEGNRLSAKGRLGRTDGSDAPISVEGALAD
jgi:hypothetical protein